MHILPSKKLNLNYMKSYLKWKLYGTEIKEIKGLTAIKISI